MKTGFAFLTVTAFVLITGALRSAMKSEDKSFPLAEPDYDSKRPLDFTPFEDALNALTDARIAELDELVIEATIPDLQAAFAAGTLTSEELITYYIWRIRAYDFNRFNAVIELNPAALDIAREKDAERGAGNASGGLHGIPVLLKDNIAAYGDMHWTAGAWALRELQPDRDAFLVQKIREGGGIIIGKTNLSEFANWMSDGMPNGFSTLGGQTRHPYGPFDPIGSSSGSAVSVAANFASVAVGSETSGSIISPARTNAIVGIKTSRGLVSRDYIIPLLEATDVAGPMGRTVTDVAILLTAMTGTDSNDPATQDAVDLAGTDFTQYLTMDGIDQLRVAYFVVDEASVRENAAVQNLELSDDEIQKQLKQFNLMFTLDPNTLTRFEAAGIQLVPVRFALTTAGTTAFRDFLTNGFKYDLDKFLTELGDLAPYSTLAEIIAANEEDIDNRAPYGQTYLVHSEATTVSETDHRQQMNAVRQQARDVLDAILQANDVDAVIGIGLPYPAAGYPAITIPNGYQDDGYPNALVLVGGYLSEPRLIQIAYGLEQAASVRVAPDLDVSIAQIDAIEN